MRDCLRSGGGLAFFFVFRFTFPCFDFLSVHVLGLEECFFVFVVMERYAKMFVMIEVLSLYKMIEV